jgi:class 3 adenylate cyclase
VLFADLKDSTDLIRGLDPEAAQQLLDPALHHMMDAVHRFEGTVNQVLGDGIMALFGAPIAHEDHALRACYAALAMQTAMRAYTEEVRRTRGLELRMRVGLNSGEVVVRAIGNDLHMDYSAVGETTHLAARMEQLATPGSIRLSAATLRLAEGLVQVTALGPVPVKGLEEPVEVFELVGASHLRRRLQAAAVRGFTPFVGRQHELEALRQALARAQTGQGQVVALVWDAGVGKSRLVYECVHSHCTQGWRVLESASASYGKATPYFPVIALLKRYCHVDDSDDARTIRAKAIGQVFTLDEALQDTIPALLALLDALPDDSPFVHLDPAQRRQRTLEALQRVLLRESQVQPLLLVFEDLHWMDSETQALLDNLVDSLPTAHLLLLVNYRPEYQHGWGNKTYYTQLRLDPLPPASAEAFLAALLGDDPSLAPLTPLLSARTAGKPFFLEESVRTLVETGVLTGAPGAYRLASPLQGLQVPATVQTVLAVRIDRLPPEDKHLLQTAAVIGTDVPFALLQAIVDVPEAALHRGLAHLQAAELWLAQALSALGACAEGRGHGEEALRLATLAGRGATPVIVHNNLGHLYLAPGDLEPASRVLEQGLALCRASGNWNVLPMIAAGLSYASALQGRLAEGRALWRRGSAKVSARAHGRIPSRSPGSVRSVVWREVAMRPGGTRARRSTWPGSSRNAGTRRVRCTSLVSSMPTPPLPMPRSPKPITSRPSPWPRNSACARLWPTATAAWAPCTPRPVSESRPAPNSPPPSPCTVPWP